MTKIITRIEKPSASVVGVFPGTYKIECWGAQGGIGLRNGVKVYPGGKGAYTSGIITIKKFMNLYLFVGGKGSDGNPTKNTIAAGGYNGGGNGGPDTAGDDGSGGGGGATDVRLINGDWDNQASILSRIMVAAGGSGSVYEGCGAPGGALNGFIDTANFIESFAYSTTNQTNGYKLGVGENGRGHTDTPSSGAGSGYYGGLAVNGINEPTYKAVSSSGSSFISGYPDCNAVDANGNHLGTPFHYSGFRFNNPQMKSGNETFLSPHQESEKGHEGDGAVLITLVRSFGYMTCNRKRNGTSFIVCQIIALVYS